MYTQLKLDALKTKMKMYSELVYEYAKKNGKTVANRGKSKAILVEYKRSSQRTTGDCL